MTKGKEPMVYMRFRLQPEDAAKMQEYADMIGGERGDLSKVYRHAIDMYIAYKEGKITIRDSQ